MHKNTIMCLRSDERIATVAGVSLMKKGKPVSVRLPLDLAEMLEAGSMATGVSVSEIVAECVSLSSERVIMDMLARKEEAKARFLEYMKGREQKLSNGVEHGNKRSTNHGKSHK